MTGHSTSWYGLPLNIELFHQGALFMKILNAEVPPIKGYSEDLGEIISQLLARVGNNSF